MSKDKTRDRGSLPFTVIPGGKGTDRTSHAEPALRVLTCRVCKARDGVDSWGAIVLVKPCTDEERVIASHQLLLCARCFQQGVRTYLGPTGAFSL